MIRADASTLGVNWAQQVAVDVSIVSNLAHCLVSGFRANVWVTDTFSANHSSQIVHPDVSVGYSGPAVRLQNITTGQGYWLVTSQSDNHMYIVRLDDASASSIAVLVDCGNIAANAMTAKLSVNGTVLTASKNGSSIGTYDYSGDGTQYSGGGAGFVIGATGATLGSWTGDNVSGGGGGGLPIPIVMNLYRQQRNYRKQMPDPRIILRAA